MPVLGNGTHSLDRVTLREIGNATTDGLDVPRDLAFHPDHPEQLWVVNYGDTSVIQFFNPGTPQKTSRRRASDGGEHFLAHPAALAFGAPGFLATAPDENQITQVETPASFMGPTLWTSDPDVFDGGHDSHLDMLHNSPSAQGIAWERDNVYWVVDGAHRSLTRYDFHQPHELGGTDHSDGEVQRYVQGEVGYVPHVSSHIEYDAASGLVYLADTGNARIAVLDPRPGTRGAAIVPNYDGDVQYRMDNTELRTLVDGAGPAGLRKPSGLALVDGTLYVTDNETSRVLAFDAATGTLRDWIDLSGTVATGGLMGVAMSPAGTLYLTDAVGNRVLELAAR